MKKAKPLLKRAFTKVEKNTTNEVHSSKRTEEGDKSGSIFHTDQEPEALAPEVSLIRDDNTMSPELISWKQEPQESESEWVDIEHEMGVKSLNSESLEASYNGYVVM